MEEPHPKLIPLLKKHDLPFALFKKKGRPPEGVRSKRSAIVTELHRQGTPWSVMMEITGLSNGAIQRLTKAMRNPATRAQMKKRGKALGSAWKGRSRPGQLEKQWANGDFDFHRGRARSEEEIQKIKESWTPEQRKAHGSFHKALWADPAYRAKMVAYHRQPKVRAERSRAQTRRMELNPSKWARGKAQWVRTPKGVSGRTFVRSSYEKAAITLLEMDPLVVSYKYEPVFQVPSGKWCKPDFLVKYRNGSLRLIEVKASWVLHQPMESKHQKKLLLYARLAQKEGLQFEVWTEKGVLRHVV